jgi:hypothetical protein
VHVFIEVSARTCMSTCVCTVFLKKRVIRIGSRPITCKSTTSVPLEHIFKLQNESKVLF